MTELKKQYNFISGKDYEGHNQVELLKAKLQNGYASDAWITFLQARDKGLKIKKGSHGVGIFKGFGTTEQKTTDKDGKTKIKVGSAPLGFARVFNLDQTEEATRQETENIITKNELFNKLGFRVVNN